MDVAEIEEHARNNAINSKKRLVIGFVFLGILCSISGCGETAVNYADLQMGDTISFGQYEQDGDLDNGYEDIQWIVCDNSDNELQLISEKILDVQPYRMLTTEDTSWEESYLREWLNSEFYENAFSDEEKEIIVKRCDYEDTNKVSNLTGGGSSENAVTIMSASEATWMYIYMHEDTVPVNTEYVNQKIDKIEQEGYICSGHPWLRTPGRDLNYNCTVDASGNVDYIGYLHKVIGTDNVEAQRGVRPFITIKY